MFVALPPAVPRARHGEGMGGKEQGFDFALIFCYTHRLTAPVVSCSKNRARSPKQDIAILRFCSPLMSLTRYQLLHSCYTRAAPGKVSEEKLLERQSACTDQVVLCYASREVVFQQSFDTYSSAYLCGSREPNLR